MPWKPLPTTNLVKKRMFKKIRIISLLLISLTLVTPMLLLAQVYKHVDEEGNVTYSDEPQKKGDQPISLPEPTTIKIAPAPKSSTNSEGRKKAPPKKSIKYDSVEIVSPNNDEAIRSNSGDITIQISSSPELQTNHLYAVYVDGAKMLASAAPTVNLTNLDRGSHTATVQIQDENEQTLATSSPITFHLLRASVH